MKAIQHIQTDRHANAAPKPFLTGTVTDENMVKNSLKFFGTMILVFFVAFIACVSASFSNIILRIVLNAAVIGGCLLVFYNIGAGRGADAVARGEILYQKKERGQPFSESERKICFHPAKGYVTGISGTVPFLIVAVILAAGTTLQTTGAGALPSWMQAYARRSDIGNALVNYTKPESMHFPDYIRIFIRVCIMPFVNIIGYSNKHGMYILERLCPLILLLPAVSYGTGYIAGKKIRTRIHHAIVENDKKRARTERKRRKKRSSNQPHMPEQLN